MAESDKFLEARDHKVQTILVVEDDSEVGEFLITALHMELGCHVLLATDVAQVLEIIKTVIPNLFLLDYNLPGTNGLELADLLAAMPTFTHVPVLLMSANPPQQELQERHITLLEKPFELEEVLQAIEKLEEK